MLYKIFFWDFKKSKTVMQILQLFCFLSFSTQEDDYTQKKTLVSIKVQWGGEKIYQNLQRGVYEREPWMIGERSRDLVGES